MNKNEMDKILGMALAEIEEEKGNITKTTQQTISVYNAQGHLEEDYELARSTLHGAVSAGNTALLKIIELAKESDHPRTFEVAANLIKTMADLSKDLIELQRGMKEVSKPEVNTPTEYSNQYGEKLISTSPAAHLDEMEDENDS